MFMTKVFRLIVVMLMVLAVTVPNTQAQRKKQIAVLDFDFATLDIGLAHRAYGGQKNLARRVADKLINSLMTLKTCQVIERSQIDKVFAEQDLGASGRIDPNTAAKFKRVLGVDALIYGNVSVFELRGLPKDNKDTMWDPRDMSARIAVNFRIVDTTTGVVELSNEMIGMSAQGPKRSAGARFGMGILNDMVGGGKVQVKDEQVRDVVGQAVEDVIGKMTLDVEKYLKGELRPPEPILTSDKIINGRVLSVRGPSLVITNINKSAVRVGDRLFVRRFISVTDPETKKATTFSEKIGEVEVIEIQDEVIMGSFTGSGEAQRGDTVTNSPSGAGVTGTPIPESKSPPSAGNTLPPSTNTPSTNITNTQSTNTTRSFSSGKNERVFTVSANQPWLDTGIEVQPNTNYEFIAEGVSNVDRVNKVSAAGIAVSASRPRLPLPGSPLGALLAKVRYPNGKYSAIVLVGAKGNAKTDPGETGRLMLGINDDNFADNTGSFKVTVRW